MNNYAYLIKAKAKATEAKSLFCWFTAKSDTRAEREILNILEDEGIAVGRSADHQLPIRTNFPVLDDLPEDSSLDVTWCERYQLDENGCWQKIIVQPATQPSSVDTAGSDASIAESAVSNLPVENQAMCMSDADSAAGSCVADDLQTEYADDESAAFQLATMPFRIQVLAQFCAEDRHVYHISIPHRNALSLLEMDVDNSYVQNLLLAAENVPEVKTFDIPTLWKFTAAVKAVFPQDKRNEMSLVMRFVRIWVSTEHIDRGLLVKEWAKGNRVSQIQRTDSNTNAGGGNKTDRNSDYEHTLDTLDVEIALATLPMDFDIYNIPVSIHRRAKEIVSKNESPFEEWSKALRKTAGILDFSRAAIFALIRGATENVHHFPVSLQTYINANLTESKHGSPAAEALAAAQQIVETTGESNEETVNREEVSRQLAADRGKFVEGISDPTDPKWIHEDLTKPKQPEIANVGGGIYSIENLMPTPPATTEETSDNVQMEETLYDETSVNSEISISETRTDPIAGDAQNGDQANSVDNETGHHNEVYRNLMIDLETMGKKANAPIVSIGAVFFNPATGSTGGEFYASVSLESSMLFGGNSDAETIIWWLKQSPEARSAITMSDALTLVDALELLSNFISENTDVGSDVQVWGNGASFDNVILRSSYDRAEIECPWKYWNDRDVRTITEMGSAVGIKPRYDIPFEGDMHNALSDARHQVKYVSAIWRELVKN
ncbi:exonuclease [Kluyvera intermedia]|uniref:3'-5' exoribonuclease n=1 Tax=Kluyvera intermedia TaxID=61648 RepID=A0AA95JZ14_KLUIN|nr:exonuclease [Kluyvera intermedia]WGL54665.1 3'-5' exoribonuclease [Kluyvera intermedia]